MIIHHGDFICFGWTSEFELLDVTKIRISSLIKIYTTPFSQPGKRWDHGRSPLSLKRQGPNQATMNPLGHLPLNLQPQTPTSRCTVKIITRLDFLIFVAYQLNAFLAIDGSRSFKIICNFCRFRFQMMKNPLILGLNTQIKIDLLLLQWIWWDKNLDLMDKIIELGQIMTDLGVLQSRLSRRCQLHANVCNSI